MVLENVEFKLKTNWVTSKMVKIIYKIQRIIGEDWI
jgi:hypothetical protein